MILVFDLDDTLYDELTYVKSGFTAVSRYLDEEWNIPQKKSKQLMMGLLKKSREKIFDKTLKHYNRFSARNVKKCLTIYHFHEPTIKLYPEAKICLANFKSIPVYLVTDGNKIVQHKKILALGLDKIVKKYYITYRHGKKHSKPSPYCFEKIRQLEKVDPSKIVYIGDNPLKDFVEIKKLGYKTIRLMNGQYKDVVVPPTHEAHLQISSLSKLNLKLIKSIKIEAGD